MAAALRGAVGMASLIGVSATGFAADPVPLPDQVLTSVLQQSIGAPARAMLDDQATVRLSGRS
jgi:hypothetical protein